jgi:ribulose-bisphosphate carboxylase large chain
MKYIDYVNTKYRPKRTDLLCYFYLDTDLRKETVKEAAGAVASESSIGTWTETATTKKYVQKLAAKVYEIKKAKKKDAAFIKIAYPAELFEADNVPDIISSIAGNIFGMKEVKHLRLRDIIFPKNIAKKFKGPKYGIKGVRKITGIKNRPLIGTIVKPKLGLRTADHAKVAYDAWLGGCDIVKDDENLSSQRFNKFENRLRQTLKLKRKAEKETGKKKIYMINITAETDEMIKRAKLTEKSGNEYAMVDIITTGWSALQTLRDENLNLVLHAHRAGHAAFDKYPHHGISMKVIARITRMIGLDQLHIGTAVGKMFETEQEVLENVKALTDNFHGIKKTMPVASGGLHPGMMPALHKIFGRNVIFQMGGGIHGHPEGTFTGARAAKQALDAVMKKIPLKTYARTHPELKIAIKHWGIVKKPFVGKP